MRFFAKILVAAAVVIVPFLTPVKTEASWYSRAWRGTYAPYAPNYYSPYGYSYVYPYGTTAYYTAPTYQYYVPPVYTAPAPAYYYSPYGATYVAPSPYSVRSYYYP